MRQSPSLLVALAVGCGIGCVHEHPQSERALHWERSRATLSRLVVDDVLDLMERVVLTVEDDGFAPGLYSPSELVDAVFEASPTGRLLRSLVEEEDADIRNGRYRARHGARSTGFDPTETIPLPEVESPQARFARGHGLSDPFSELPDPSSSPEQDLILGLLPRECHSFDDPAWDGWPLEPIEEPTDADLEDVTRRLEMLSHFVRIRITNSRCGESKREDPDYLERMEPRPRDLELARAAAAQRAAEEALARYGYSDEELVVLLETLPDRFARLRDEQVPLAGFARDALRRAVSEISARLIENGVDADRRSRAVGITFDRLEISKSYRHSDYGEQHFKAETNQRQIYFSPILTLAPFIACYNDGAYEYALTKYRAHRGLEDARVGLTYGLTEADLAGLADEPAHLDTIYRGCLEREMSWVVLHELAHILLPERLLLGLDDLTEEMLADCFAIVSQRMLGVEPEPSYGDRVPVWELLLLRPADASDPKSEHASLRLNAIQELQVGEWDPVGWTLGDTQRFCMSER